VGLKHDRSVVEHEPGAFVSQVEVSAGQRRVEAFSMMALWIAFFQAYASRLLQSWFFVALAAVLLYSVARFVGVALRSGNHAVRFP